MASNEAGLWDWLRGVLPLGQYSRIESPDTAPGFPDVHYNLIAGCGHLELKHCGSNAATPFPNEDKGVRKSQKIWIREAIRNNATVWVIAELTPEVLVIHGAYAHMINGSERTFLYTLAEAVLDIYQPEHAARVLEKILVLKDYTTP